MTVELLAPGSTVACKGSGGMFSLFEPMIAATDGLTLSQVCAITGLEACTLQNWIRRGFVARPVRKKYYARQLARILLISALRSSMPIDRIGELMKLVNGDTEDNGDDIISEEKLYDDLCEVIRLSGDRVLDRDALTERIAEVTADYIGPTPESAQRLRLALSVMAQAYMSNRMKQRAEQDFDLLKTL